MGVCVIFPQVGITPRERWEKQAADYALKIGPLLTNKSPAPPTLNSLAKTIPSQAPEPRKKIDEKLHWENSKARVEIPVQEELAVHLFLDYGPLF